MNKKVVVSLMFFVFFLLISLLYYGLALKSNLHSDSTNLLLLANDITKGNIFLQDWFLVNKSFYTSDIPFYVIGILIFGFSHYLMYIVPAIIYALVATLSSWISYIQSGRSLKSALVTFVIIGIPGLYTSNLVLIGGSHTGTLFFVLVSFICAEFIYRNFQFIWLYVLFTVSLSLSLIGNDFSLWFAVIPLCLVITLRIIYSKEQMKINIRILILTIVSFIASRMFNVFIEQVNGFVVPGKNSLSFVEYVGVPKNLSMFLQSLLGIFDADFFGKSISLESLGNIVHLTSIILIILTFTYFTKNYFKINTMSQIYFVSSIVVVFEFLLSTMPQDMSSGKYLIPLFIFGSILVGKYVEKINIPYKKWIVLAFCIVYLLTSITKIDFRGPENSETRLSQFLIDNQLYNGYATYWIAGNINVYSKGKINLASVVSDESNISPFYWFSNKNFYNQESNFLVYDDSNWGQINKDKAIMIFGAPQEIYNVEQFEVLVWDKDISPYLSNKLP